MKEERIISPGQKTISLKDDDTIYKLNKIMTVSSFNKSFNKVINKVINYGVIKLYNELFPSGEDSKVDTLNPNPLINEYLFENIKLLNQQIIDLAIIKSTVSSLYNVYSKTINGESVSKEKLDTGAYRQTPKYLQDYESMAKEKVLGDNSE